MNVQKKLAFALIRAKLNSLYLLNPKKAGEEAFRLFCTPPKKSKRVSQVLKRFEHLQFQFDGKLIHGYRCNHPGKKRILLLHGFSSSCHNFDKYVQPLIDKGYEVLAFDAPAHGASEGQTTNALEYSGMILKVIELYGRIDGYIAHSFGGLAVSLAMEHIQHGPETKIALIAPATETTTAIDSALKLIGFKKPGIRDAMEQYIFDQTGNHADWFSVRRAMYNIKASVLWLHDVDDDITPLSDAIQVKQAGHPNITFSITNGLGHQKIYRDPLVMKHIIDYL